MGKGILLTTNRELKAESEERLDFINWLFDNSYVDGELNDLWKKFQKQQNNLTDKEV